MCVNALRGVSMSGTNPNISSINLTTGNSLTYDYDGEYSRIKETAVSKGATGSSATTTTIYVGAGYFERITNPDNTVEYRHYLAGLDGTAGVLTRRIETSGANIGNAINTTRYWYKDHLGSPVAEFDGNAQTGIAANFTAMGFDTWGMRRKTTAANTFTESLALADLDAYASPRGYTGHQQLDELGLIHMNGRIYDPLIGRFLQVDPIIQEPYNGQNFNRYTYVLNNPLAYTDPTGYSFWTEVRRPVAAIAVAIITYKIVGPLAAAHIASAGPPTLASIQAANAFTAAASGFASGGVAGGNIESAIYGAFQSAALFGVGEVLGHTDAGFFQGNYAARIVAHASIGCVASGVQGGSCGAGAASAGFAAFAGPLINTGSFAGDLAGHAVAGGLGSVAAGGKFGNGAATGAFGYLFNRCGASLKGCVTEKEAAIASGKELSNLSQKDKKEHGVAIYKESDGTYHHTEPVTDGRTNAVDIGKAFSQVPGGIDKVTALNHSHVTMYGQNPRAAEDFSRIDRQVAQAKNNPPLNRDVNIYLVTPRGDVKFWDPRKGGQSETVGKIK